MPFLSESPYGLEINFPSMKFLRDAYPEKNKNVKLGGKEDFYVRVTYFVRRRWSPHFTEMMMRKCSTGMVRGRLKTN